MARRKVVTMALLCASGVVLAALAALHAQRRQAGTHGEGEAGSGVFRSDVPSAVLFEVRKIEDRLSLAQAQAEKDGVAPDKATLDALIADLARSEYVTVDGEQKDKLILARHQLRDMGRPALPALAAAATHPTPSVRPTALRTIYDIADAEWQPADFVPLFARSLWDEDPKVRRGAAATLGRLGHDLRLQSLQVAHYLETAFKEDPDEGVRYQAGRGLFDMDRRDLLPKSVIKEHEREYHGR